MEKTLNKLNKLFMGVLIGLSAWSAVPVSAQNGDQILDGIGETGMISRYTFKTDGKDWSRNNLHTTIKGAGYSFTKDNLLEGALSISGKKEAFISIPSECIMGEESLSLSGWFFPRSNKAGQYLFDFGKNAQSHFYFAPFGTKDSKSGLAQIVAEGKTYDISTPAPELNKWSHVVMVMDVPAKSVRLFINGKRVGEIKDLAVDLSQIFDYNVLKNNTLLLSKGMDVKKSTVNASLADFRLYRIPLTERQIMRIFFSVIRKGENFGGRREESDRNLPVFPAGTPQLYNAFLTSVQDVEVETTVGTLPRLPYYIHGVYSDGKKGPDVRVIWPSPKDNSEVLKAGTYTVTGKIAGSALQPKATVVVKDIPAPATPDRTLEAFKLNQVALNLDDRSEKTKFIENRDKFINGLVKTNPDNFLYMFRNAFGQKQPAGAEALGVWDSQDTKLRGHATGHYLTAIAQAYASTDYDPALKASFASKMDYMVNTLYDLSQLSGKPQTAGGPCVTDPTMVPPGPGKSGYDSDLSENGIRTDYWNWGSGFISAYPPDQFIMLEKGANYGGDNTRIWAPYYTLHKILAGLMDIYEISGNEKALTVVKGMGNWVYARLSQVPTETLISMWNRYIAGEFGGMNDAMARLYRITKDDRYLKCAKLFDNIKVFYGDAQHNHGLAKNVDTFRGLHANQHIPQIIGALEIYRDTESPEYYHVADNFWDMVTHDYMYSIGGVAGARNPANAECFPIQPNSLYENGFDAGGQNETCGTYNMLKLTSDLFLFNKNSELMDYYERGLYNQILSSVAENSPANTYHISLRAGAAKQFGNPNMDGFTCCNGTALESSTKLQNTIYFKSADNKALYVNLYIPSTLKWTENNVTITQSTAYPKEDRTKLTIKGNGTFDLNVRVPHWATRGFFVTINGKDEPVQATPGSYLTIRRTWKDGDVVELRMPFKFYLEPVMDQQNIASLFYGPVLLAAQENEQRSDWRKVTLDANDPGKTIQGDPSQLLFSIDGVEYKPFYNSYKRYSVYLDVTLK